MNAGSRICVVTAANAAAEGQYSLTNPNKAAYCARHGYEYRFVGLEGSEYAGDPHFSKYWLVEREIRSGAYKYVVWMDADAWFNNADTRLEAVIGKYERRETSLVIARDQGMLGCDARLFDNYVNTGVMAFKSSDGALELLRRYGKLRGNQTVRRMVEAMTPRRDQPYMCLLALADEFARERIAVASPYDMNTFAQCGFDGSTFICHCPSREAKARMAEFMRRPV